MLSLLNTYVVYLNTLDNVRISLLSIAGGRPDRPHTPLLFSNSPVISLQRVRSNTMLYFNEDFVHFQGVSTFLIHRNKSRRFKEYVARKNKNGRVGRYAFAILSASYLLSSLYTIKFLSIHTTPNYIKLLLQHIKLVN